MKASFPVDLKPKCFLELKLVFCLHAKDRQRKVEGSYVNTKKRKREDEEDKEEEEEGCGVDQLNQSDSSAALLPFTRVTTHDDSVLCVQQYFTYLPNNSSSESDSQIEDIPIGGQDDDERRKKGAEEIKQMVTDAHWKIKWEDIKFGPELGAGFFGKVYKGIWQGKAVAIKVITRCEFRNDTDIELFQREIAVLGKLRHKNVVEFLGVGMNEDGGRRCILTEFMAGGSLKTLLDYSYDTITERMKRKIAKDVAEAMNYLHKHTPKVIHRDLSSNNILLSGDHLTAKVADFGMSRLIDQSSSSDNKMTMAVGALAWMAPEVFSGQNYTEKVDVYSFGICLAELLTGKDPYQGMEPYLYASLATKEGLRPPIPDTVCEHWRELAESCWIYEPKIRPSFTKIIEYLDHYLPTPSPSSSPSPSTSPCSSPSPPSSPSLLSSPMSMAPGLVSSDENTPIPNPLITSDDMSLSQSRDN